MIQKSNWLRQSLVAALVLTAFANGTRASDVAQFAPDPVVFDQPATNDNLVVLMAAASEYDSDLTLIYSGPSWYPKTFWFDNWSSTNDYMKWNVALATGDVYHVYAKLSAGANDPLTLSVTGTGAVLNFTTRNIGWDKLDCGTISLPAGTSQLVLQRDSNSGDNISIISLELMRESDLAAYEQRVASFRSDTTWLSQSKYGLMTQFGAWSYPPSGPQPSLQDFANGFNVTNFVNLVTNTGSKYVIFSLTWYTYQMLAPIQSVDNIVPGNTNLTSTRDVIGELATALHSVGVRFMVYYHTGQDSQWGYDSTAWWQAQQFPEPDHTDRGTGDRSMFFTNWCNVITEIGNRYATNLDGWFFDDGMVYYPAPFEHLGQAAKAGNPNRLVSYNPWIAVSYTDFEDVWFGEGSHGESQFDSSTNGTGIFTDGPHQGTLQNGMFPMEQDWGVYEQNQPINTQISASQAIAWVRNASAMGVPLSFNMMMWSDGTYSAQSLAVMQSLKSAIYGGASGSSNSNNLVVNGTFETPATASYTPFVAGSTALTGWTIDAAPSDGLQLGTAGIFGPDNGSQNLQLSGGSTYSVGGGISQTITTTPGATYTISIDVASRQGNAITGNSNFGGSNHVLNASSKTAFTTLTWQAVATASNTVIDITGYTNSASGQLIIDNVHVVEVPPLVQPFLGAPVKDGNGFSFSFTGTNGQPYTIISSTNVAAPVSAWVVQTGAIFGVNNMASFTNATPTDPQKFYRVESP